MSVLNITAYSSIRGGMLERNGELMLESSAASIAQEAYNKFAINYPKFYKMDNLCKTGFITTEMLLRECKLSEEYAPEEIGIVISTANSSIDTDYRFGQSSQTTPSPSLFVYTLPNILIGEICIRHRIKGESACFAFDIFDAAFQTSYINTLFESGKVKACIGGWADYYQEGQAFFYLVEARKGITEHNNGEVERLFSKSKI